MVSKIEKFGNQTIIKQKKFNLWQFRMWISSEKNYFEKSLCTKMKN